jgi:hypothetical protein
MRRLKVHLLVVTVLLTLTLTFALAVNAQTDRPVPMSKGPLDIVNKHFSTRTITFSDGTILDENIINGPPKPPKGFEKERAPVSLPISGTTMATGLSEVPAFKWVFGCSSVSGAMIAGYYDRTGYSDIYTGNTDGGLIPWQEDPSWGSWTDSSGDEYPNNPLIASHDGLDGRSGYGSIDDYWVSYGSSANDPYIGNWDQHAWGDAIGDYMKTSQSAYGNTDGATTFYSYSTSSTPLTCSTMKSLGIDEVDGTYGRKLFYEARGYTVTDCYAQATDNAKRGGFSFAQYKAEIDAGRPVFLNLQGHSIVGVGYDDSTKTVYLHDTWDNLEHSMTWGTSYSGMKLQSVSIVNLQNSTPPQSETDLSGYWSGVTSAKKGKVYTITGNFVAQNGAVNVNNVIVNFYLSADRTPSDSELVATYTFTSISANSSASTAVKVNTKTPPSGKYLIAVIDPSNTIKETNETNNSAYQTVP